MKLPLVISGSLKLSPAIWHLQAHRPWKHCAFISTSPSIPGKSSEASESSGCPGLLPCDSLQELGNPFPHIPESVQITISQYLRLPHN